MRGQVFERLRAEQGAAVFGKVRPVAGDVSLPGLGLSEGDRRRLQAEVNIVFHSAATVRFNEGLAAAVSLNTVGTQRVVRLCKEMLQLKVRTRPRCTTHDLTPLPCPERRLHLRRGGNGLKCR